MTLVSAFKNRGIPLLIGDFLLTDRHRRASGLSKKVHLMGPNVAIGWAGSLITAVPVLRDLYALTKDNFLTRRELENFLTEYPRHELRGEAHLIGWVIDGKSQCFLWNTLAPSHIHWDETIIDGSGEEGFLKVLDSAGGWGITEPSSSNLDSAIKYALFATSHLMSDEVLARNNQKLGFGHAYEILYYDGLRFRSVENVIYSIFDLNLKPHVTTCTPELYTFFRYFTLDGNSIIEQLKMSSDERRFDLITPVFERGGSQEYSFESTGIDRRLNFSSSDYYLCGLARYIPPTNKISILPFVVPPKAKNPLAFIRNVGRQTEFNLNLKYFLDTYSKLAQRGKSNNLELSLKHLGPGAGIDLSKVKEPLSPGTLTLRWRMGKRSDDLILVDLVGGVFQNRISVSVTKNKSIQLKIFDAVGRKSQITSKPYSSATVLHVAVVWDAASISLFIGEQRIGTRRLFKSFTGNWRSLLVGIDIEGQMSIKKLNMGYMVDGIRGLNLERDRKLKGARLTDVALFPSALSEKRIQQLASSSAEDVILNKQLSRTAKG
jgi:hypothetical protein